MASKTKIVLGSSSPRRKDLLGRLGLEFTIVKPETEEKRRPEETPQQYVERNAQEKAAWVIERQEPNAVVIAADTIVVLKDEILEKPKSIAEAKRMLTALSHEHHRVLSGVCVGNANKIKVFSCETKVWIKPLCEAEIDQYIKTGEPMDKAGSYAAQGMGSYMVQRIEGSYANVVGLPIAEVVQILESEFQVSMWEQ